MYVICFTYSNTIKILFQTYAKTCLLYTSDAADEEDSVDLGGRRIIKKKGKHRTNSLCIGLK